VKTKRPSIINITMSSIKRKAVDSLLNRRVRARREASEELAPEISESSINGDEMESDQELSHGESEDNEDGSGESDEDDESESSQSEGPNEAASISFGALAKAQATLTGPRKAKNATKGSGDNWEDNEAAERKAGHKDHRDFNRSSKHAPTEISSKKAVSRRREVIPVKKRDIRDPRFERLTGDLDEERVKAAYSFLDDYRQDEMNKLKEEIKKTKDEDQKEKLKRSLLSMESRMKAEMRKKKEKEVLDRHRKEEKENVKMGKKPFYLKKSEQKKQVLMDQFKDLKGKQLDRVIERRRKKVEGKEKKNMPFARRGVES